MTVNIMERSRTSTTSTSVPAISTTSQQQQQQQPVPPQKIDIPKVEHKTEAGGKETILVGLNSRVKNLEKNATLIRNIIKQLNTTVGVHTADMEGILEAVIKAKESFTGATKEIAQFKTKMKAMSEADAKFDKFMEDTSQTMKVNIHIISFLKVTIYLVRLAYYFAFLLHDF